jgi:hypothetical protein
MAIDLQKRTAGRPTALTDIVWNTLVSRVKGNNYIPVACAAAGINRRTLSEWMTWAKDVDDYIYTNNIPMPLSKEELTQDIYDTFPDNLRIHIIYWYLFQDLKTAEAQGIQDLNDHILNAAPKNWLAAMTLLERRHPDMYGKRDAVDVNVQDSQELLRKLSQALQITPAN